MPCWTPGRAGCAAIPKPASPATIVCCAAGGLDAATASPYAAALGVGIALSRGAGALDYFARVRAEDFDETTHEWHVRAALWAGDWRRVTVAIEAMPTALASQNRWRYWAGRARRKKSGDTVKARESYALVIPTDNWYAVLASARLGREFAPSLQPIQFDRAEVAQLATAPGMVRARELLACDLESEAMVEWRLVYDTLTPAQQRAPYVSRRTGTGTCSRSPPRPDRRSSTTTHFCIHARTTRSCALPRA
jgi:soluble lytic murein transglycosylase